MKTKTKLSTLILIALATSLYNLNIANSQTTAVTKSYGYLTLTNLGEAWNSLPFHRREAYQGRVASVSGSSITLQGTPNLTANQFVYTPPSQNNKYYMLIRSGASEGEFFDVTGNTANTVTVSASMVGVLSPGDKIAIIPKWSLSTLFPNGSGVISVPNLANLTSGTGIYTISPNTTVASYRSANSTPYHFNGSIWRFGALPTNQSHNLVFNPTDAYVIRHHNNTGPIQLLQGWVEDADVAILVARDTNQVNMNLIALPRPVAYSLSELGLINNINVTGSLNLTQFFNTQSDYVTLFNNTLNIYPKSPDSTGYWLNTSVNQWKFGPLPLNQNNSKILQPGRAFALIRQPGTSANSDIINSKIW